MKRFLIFIISVFMYLNTYGELGHLGKIVYMSNPCDTFSCSSGLVYGLEIACGNTYFLTINRQLICSDDNLTVDGTAYYVNDVVQLQKELLINGCDTIIYSYPVFDIIAMKKYPTTNRDIQRFLGTYSITAICEHAYPGPSNPFSETIKIVIEEGTDSDLLIHFSSEETVRAFVTNDNSFEIPRQIFQYHYNQNYLTGNGVIKNDSICLSYYYGEVYAYDTDVACNNCKQGTSIVLLPATPNKVYYNAINQTIIIDEGLQNQSLTLVLYDIQGKILLREINVSNSINIAHLPQGVYVYRLLQNNQIIYRGKVLK